MEKYLLLLFLSCCGAFTICGAQTVTVRGRVIDRKTGEVLSDANVADLVLGTGVATNSYGLYSIHVKSKQCILRCSMLGYATKIDTLTLAVNMVHDFALMPDNYQLNDVEIVGERKFGGQLALTQKEIQSFPTLGSEPDVLKSLQYLPGVISGNEGTNNISVEGVISGGIWFCWTKQWFIIRIMLYLSFQYLIMMPYNKLIFINLIFR